MLEFLWKRRHEQHQERRDGETSKCSRQQAEHAIRPTKRRTCAQCMKWSEKHASCETDDSETDDPGNYKASAGCEINWYPPLAYGLRN